MVGLSVVLCGKIGCLIGVGFIEGSEEGTLDGYQLGFTDGISEYT